MENYYLAVDIGASSGRHILGTVKDGTISLEGFTVLKTVWRRETAISAGMWNPCFTKSRWE